MPTAEVAIDEALVRTLLQAQHPDLAGLALSRFTEGWDNVSFRLGEALLVRLPRRAMAALLVVHEQRWLPRLGPALPLPIPVPLRDGVPSDFYPWCWSVVPFLAGEPVDDAPLGATAGTELGAFLRALHSQPVPVDAPTNAYRGGSLNERISGYANRAQSLKDKNLLPARCEHLWEAALEAPIDVAPVWLHGDLHPRNVLSRDGHVSAVIDWGDICSGDPATDLAGLWALLDTPAQRERAFAAYVAVSDATLVRTRGWAVYFGVVHLASGVVNSPRHSKIGTEILRRLAEES